MNTRTQTYFLEDDEIPTNYGLDISPNSLGKAKQLQAEKLAELESQLASIKTNTLQSRITKQVVLITIFVGCLWLLLSAI